MSTPQRNVVGQVYRCEVCGAEVSVIKGGEGELAPQCCNEPMSLLPELHRSYFCPVCGAELLVLHEGAGELAPRCCNEPMVARKRAA
jgi:desulfoferrodoxin-like iron-binding protein